MSGYTLIDLETSPYHPRKEIEKELALWETNNPGDDEGIAFAIIELKDWLRWIDEDKEGT